jgi:hypothetical protein
MSLFFHIARLQAIYLSSPKSSTAFVIDCDKRICSLLSSSFTCAGRSRRLAIFRRVLARVEGAAQDRERCAVNVKVTTSSW